MRGGSRGETSGITDMGEVVIRQGENYGGVKLQRSRLK